MICPNDVITYWHDQLLHNDHMIASFKLSFLVLPYSLVCKASLR